MEIDFLKRFPSSSVFRRSFVEKLFDSANSIRLNRRGIPSFAIIVGTLKKEMNRSLCTENSTIKSSSTLDRSKREISWFFETCSWKRVLRKRKAFRAKAHPRQKAENVQHFSQPSLPIPPPLCQLRSGFRRLGGAAIASPLSLSLSLTHRHRHTHTRTQTHANAYPQPLSSRAHHPLGSLHFRGHVAAGRVSPPLRGRFRPPRSNFSHGSIRPVSTSVANFYSAFALVPSGFRQCVAGSDGPSCVT